MSSRTRNILRLVGFTPIFAAIYYLAFLIRFDGVVAGRELAQWLVFVPAVVLVKLLTFQSMRGFHDWRRPVTFDDLLAIAKAAAVSTALLILVRYAIYPTISTPRSVTLLDFGLTIFCVGGVRAALRLLEEYPMHFADSDRKPVIIAGTSPSSEAFLRVIRRSSQLKYSVVGITSDNSRVFGSLIEGVPVLGRIEETCALAERCGVDEILITSGGLRGRDVRKLVQSTREAGVSVKVMPCIEQVVEGKVRLQPREVSVEDLLKRDAISLDLPELHRWIDQKTLLVTGSAGSIGSEICRQLLNFAPQRLVMVDRWENGQFDRERELKAAFPNAEIEVVIGDITDSSRMSQIFMKYRPDIVFHAAAYKHVPLMEANPGEAIKNISLATQNLADLADRTGVDAFVMISTDKAVNPTNVMGTCKRVAELYVQAIAQKSECRFVTVRFGNVLDSAGSVVPTFREQIANGGPITVTHPDINRFFMTIPEASQLVIQAGAMGKGGEIFVLDMGEPVKIVDLANDMIRLCGLRPGEDIEIDFVGLRPGEKLYEELHVEGEEHLATSHPKIMVTNSIPERFDLISTALAELESLTSAPREQIIEELCRVVPQYKPQQIPAVPQRRAA